MNKKLISIGSFAVMAILTFSIIAFNASNASAKAIIEKSIVTISKMTSEELSVIQKIIGSDPADSLKEAYKAKDLKEISKKEFNEIFDNNKGKGSYGIAFKVPNDKSVDNNIKPGTIVSVDMKESTDSINTTKSNYIDLISKYLIYTDSNGRLIGLGLDKDGLPMIKQIM